MSSQDREPFIRLVMLVIIITTIVLVVFTQALQRESEAELQSEAKHDEEHNPEQAVADAASKHEAVKEEEDQMASAIEQAEVKPVIEAPRVRFEAELARLNGTKVEALGNDYSGEGYVTDFTDEDDYAEIPISIEEEGLYTLYINYRAVSGYKESDLFVDGKPFGKVVFQQSNSFTEVKATRIMLQQGEHSVTLRRGWGYFDIDYVEIQRYNDELLSVAPVTEKLSNPNASSEAVELMDYMNEQAGKRILSGQQLYSHIADIEVITGKRPAIVGFDFIEYSPTRAANGSRSSEVEAALSWHKQGGIVTFLWHWNAPTGLIDEPGKEWWRGFYTDSVTFNLADALADKNGEEYALLLSDMDVIAQQIKILQLNDVPILFRPLHEAEGGWFWWGASGPEAAKELYRIMYDRFVNDHKLNNLIWVWNSVAPEWYPGDDVVDIVSFDSYPVAGDHSPIVNVYDDLVQLTNGTKYVAMMENGSIPHPDLMEAYGANWGLFVTWSGHFIMDQEHNSNEFLKELYWHPRVITLDQLPRYKEINK